MPTSVAPPPLKYPDLRNHLAGSLVDADRQQLDLHDPSTGEVIARGGGYFLGPTIIDRVTPEMRIAREEVFGPVLVIIHTRDVDEALEIENASPYGNAASVFTESGGIARRVMERASAGMIGVNVGVPVPREPFSFGGWNESRFGVGDITGRGSIELWTQTKKLTTRWNTTGSETDQ